MNLVRDVLDQQVIDRKQQKAGKIDGIALELREGQAPRVAYLAVGADVRFDRVSERLARFVRTLGKRLRHGQSPKPFHLPWSTIERASISVNLNVEATEYNDFYLENWLRDHIITKIPGNAHHKHQEKND